MKSLVKTFLKSHRSNPRVDQEVNHLKNHGKDLGADRRKSPVVNQDQEADLAIGLDIDLAVITGQNRDMVIMKSMKTLG